MDDLDRLRSEDQQDPFDGRARAPNAPLGGPLYSAPQRTWVPWIALVGLLGVAAIALWWWWAPRPAPVPTQTRATKAPVQAATPGSAGGHGLGIGEPDPRLPGLGDLDSYVRPLLAAMSSRPELAALLASDDLIRRFVVSVESVARGASPAGQVRPVAPRGAFRVTTADGATVIHPASYERYDGLVRMVEDLGPEDLARLYGRLKPRLEEAYAELGVEGTFDQVMERALQHLLATPELPAAVRVDPSRGTNYAYSDPELEGLSAAQRQLLRLGPVRAARIKAQLRKFGTALGVPPDRLTP